MTISKYTVAFGAMLVALTVNVASTHVASAQSVGDRLKQKAKDKTAQRADDQADKAVDKALDKAENAVKCVAGDDACVAKAKESGKPVVITDKQGKPLPNQPKS